MLAGLAVVANESLGRRLKQLQNGLGTVLGRTGIMAADSRDENAAGTNGA